MARMRTPRAVSIHCLILISLLAAAPSVVLAQSTPVALPANAKAVAYGDGWECERGYRAVDDACVAVTLPDNAHLTNIGDNWVCNRPYEKDEGRCILP